MGIVSFSHSPLLSILLAPVQTLAAWFVPAQSVSGRLAPPAAAQRFNQLALPFSSNGAPGTPRTAAPSRPAATRAANVPNIEASKPQLKGAVPSRLRVVREFDSNVGPACAGRMVISGRMADVCAELDRMAQREAALQAR